MKLTEIEIVSYRSVTNQVIPMNENCIGLVGLNESGKTNILSAVRMLDPGFSPSIKDKSKLNDALPKVRFVFDVSSQTCTEAIEFCKTYFTPSVTMPYHSLSTRLIVQKYQAIRQLELVKGAYKKIAKFICHYNIKVEGQYFKPKEQTTIPTDLSASIDEKVFLLSKIQLIAKGDLPDSAAQFFEPANEDYIRKIFLSPLYQFFEKKLPKVVYWQYDQRYLLPSEITYAAFISDEDPYSNCAPLYNIMLLSQRLNVDDSEELISKISEWEEDSSLRRRDANIVTEDLNHYIKRIWPDFDQKIRIELEESKITVHIHDPQSNVGNFYEMESRSQGFKTFISFMLTISAEIDTDQIQNSILLLDEPETHLHPSGARFMRDELLKLSKGNFVLFATHSIFMIDRSNIRRHLIVKKENEATQVSFVGRNNFIQESVIYEALGTTVDEFSVRNRNIIFEGKMDMVLFQYLINNCISKRGNTLLDYELHDAGGTKNIISFFKNKTIPQDSEWIVVLDNDLPGKSVPTEIAKSTLNTSNIKYLFYSTKDGEELEDVLPEIMIKDAISRTEAKLVYSPKFGFVVDPKKNISKNVLEYQHRNALEPKFEAAFKECLTELILETLDGIKETTISKKLEAYRSSFPAYFNAIRSILDSKGIKIETCDIT